MINSFYIGSNFFYFLKINVIDNSLNRNFSNYFGYFEIFVNKNGKICLINNYLVLVNKFG